MAQQQKPIRNRVTFPSGTPSPNPWDLSLSGQNVRLYNGDTRTEDKATQGCDLSAASSAGMASDGFKLEAVANLKLQKLLDSCE
jgi:hypothetical protein